MRSHHLFYLLLVVRVLAADRVPTAAEADTRTPMPSGVRSCNA